MNNILHPPLHYSPAGDLPGQAHAEARGPHGQAAAHHRGPQHGPGPLAQDGPQPLPGVRRQARPVRPGAHGPQVGADMVAGDQQDCVDGDVARFHQQFAEDLRHQGPYGAMGGGGWGDPCKASSAFSPLNTGVLPTSTGFNMGSTPRGYPFYDPISFQRQSQVGSFNIEDVILYRQNEYFTPCLLFQVGFESKTAGSNLISLSQIKNYAHDRGGPGPGPGPGPATS